MVRTASITSLPVKNRRRMPTDDEILSISRAASGEYELTDKECKTLRSRIYSINKHNHAGFRFRTLREGRLLMVWRIR